jgi:hypothetical protein
MFGTVPFDGVSVANFAVHVQLKTGYCCMIHCKYLGVFATMQLATVVHCTVPSQQKEKELNDLLSR